MINPEKTFHQRGFSGTVFAHQRMNRSAAHLQRNIIKRTDAGETFRNVLHFKQYIVHFYLRFTAALFSEIF